MTTLTKQNAPPNPLIPEKYLDVPSQRLYYLSFGLLFQVLLNHLPTISILKVPLKVHQTI